MLAHALFRLLEVTSSGDRLGAVLGQQGHCPISAAFRYLVRWGPISLGTPADFDKLGPDVMPPVPMLFRIHNEAASRFLRKIAD